MKKRYIATIAVLLPVILTSCRTTENNYREAYDIAQQKRAGTDVEVVTPGVRVQRDDEAYMRVVDGDSVPVRDAVCTRVEGPENVFALVTAGYKMNTNALAHYRRLAQADKSALLVQDTEEQYLVAPFSSQSLGEVAREYRRLSGSGKPAATPGLSSGAYILRIQSPR